MDQALAKSRGGDVFIVDNSDKDWKVLRYLRDWADLAAGLDIASGYFEIGALLGLEGQWQKIDHIRLLMGDEVSRRTKKALLASLHPVTQTLDQSLEHEKQENDFLAGVLAVVEALRSGKIQCSIFWRISDSVACSITTCRGVSGAHRITSLIRAGSSITTFVSRSYKYQRVCPATSVHCCGSVAWASAAGAGKL